MYHPAQDLIGRGAIRTDKDRHWYLAALVSLTFIIVGTLVYPDTYIRVAFHVGSVRISPMPLIFIISFPAIMLFIYHHRILLKWSILDTMMLLTTLFVCLRGVLAATNVDELGLVFGFVGYILLTYYGAAFISQVDLRVLYYILAITGIFVAAYAIIEFGLGENILFSGILKSDLVPFIPKHYYRSSSTLGGSGQLGTFMIQVVPFFMFFFLRGKSELKRVLWCLAIIMSLLSLLLSFGKDPWFTASFLAIAGVVWLVWKNRTQAKSLLFLFFSIVISLSTFILVFHSTVYAGTFSKARTSESFKPREYMWSRVPSTFMSNPLIGAGLWQGNAQVFQVNPSIDYKNRPKSIDNQYLTALIEQGFIGSVLIGSTLLIIFVQGWKVLSSNQNIASIGWPLGACMIATLINGATTNDLMIWPNMVVFWFSAGMLRALVEKTRRNTEISLHF